jgi:hypothetical protein
MPTKQKTNKNGNKSQQNNAAPSRRGIHPGDKVVNRSKRKSPVVKIKQGTDLLSAISSNTMMPPEKRFEIILNAAGTELVKRATRGNWSAEERHLACTYLKALMASEASSSTVTELDAMASPRVKRDVQQISATTLWFKRKLAADLQFVAQRQPWFQGAYRSAQERFPA